MVSMGPYRWSVNIGSWCCQAISHYLSQCWPNSRSPYGITRLQVLNSSPPRAAYMHQWTGSALVQVMTCRLFSTKPLPEQMLTHYHWTPRNKLQGNLNRKQNFPSMKIYLKLAAAKWQPFCPGRDELIPVDCVQSLTGCSNLCPISLIIDNTTRYLPPLGRSSLVICNQQAISSAQLDQNMYCNITSK